MNIIPITTRTVMLTAISGLIIGLFAILVPPPPADAGELAGAKVTSYVANTDTSTSGPITAVAANATKPITVYGIYLNVGVIPGATETVQAKCGTTLVQPFNLGTNGGYTYIFYPLRYKCAANEAFTLTKGTSTTTLNYGVWYLQQE